MASRHGRRSPSEVIAGVAVAAAPKPFQPRGIVDRADWRRSRRVDRDLQIDRSAWPQHGRIKRTIKLMRRQTHAVPGWRVVERHRRGRRSEWQLLVDGNGAEVGIRPGVRHTHRERAQEAKPTWRARQRDGSFVDAKIVIPIRNETRRRVAVRIIARRDKIWRQIWHGAIVIRARLPNLDIANVPDLIGLRCLTSVVDKIG